MRVQMSVTTKMIVILLAMMLTVTVVISTVLINESEANLVLQQQESQVTNQRRVQLFEEILHNRMVMWIDVFSQSEVKANQDVSSFYQALRRTQEYLALNFQVESIWVFDDGGLVGSSVKPANSIVTKLVKNTQTSLESRSLLTCDVVCTHYISIPIMTNDEVIPVVVLSTSMRELLYLFNRSSDARNVAMVKQAQADERLSLSLASQLSPANRLYLNSVIAALPAASSVELLISRGEQVTLEGQKLLVSLLPFSHTGGDQPYLLIVQDISASITQKEQYETLVVATAAALFLIFALLLHLFLNQYRVRLIGVSERLPMLAEHKFKEYYTAALKKSKVPLFRLTDELDVVEEAANHLAKQLEDFDGQMAINTAKLEKMAMFDVLTGLPNRNMLTFQIEKQIAHSARDDRLVALMFMDLDDFKKVNDSHGHNVGDKLLKAAAMRISKPIRETDIASRFGGDEFVVLLSDIESKTQVELVAQKLVDEFVQPFDIDGYQFYISISIGVAITQHARATPVDLLRHADIAMYEAKAKKGAGFRIYDATMNLKVMEKVELEAEARVALRENQFSLSLQPQVDMSSNQLIGFEALLRWYHPTKGFISPGEFIPHLENTAFMLELDYWVISKSAQLASELSINGYPQCKIAINLSAAQFLDPNLPEFLSKQIKDNNLSPSQLCLELTETVLVSDIIRATSIMKIIQDMGCMIAIDDFGTGYSSLSYLKSLPVDFIKIDRSFVGNIVHSADDKNIVYSTITMVTNMGLTVIAEGIETIEQYDLLKHFECHIAQGYLISRPIPETDLWSTLNDKVKNGLWDCAEQRIDM